MHHVLQIFKHATLFFSRDTPSVSTVIPAMDHIDMHLATAAQSRTYLTSIRAALTIGKWTLNRYYNKTDHSEVYRITMGMCLVIYSLLIMVSLNILQFFILAINYITSKWRGGKTLGSRPPIPLFVKSLTEPMPLWMLKVKQKRYDDTGYTTWTYWPQYPAVNFSICEYIWWFACIIGPLVFGAPRRAWPLPQ